MPIPVTILRLIAVPLVATTLGFSSGTKEPPTASGAFFALSVADLDASIQWYSDVFGMKVVLRPPKQGQASVAVLEGRGLMVELIRLDEAVPLSTAAPNVKDNLSIHGLVKAGILVDDFAATMAELQTKRVTIAFGPFPARSDQKANVIIKDNAGNLIQIIGK